jgi:hypothetical protein
MRPVTKPHPVILVEIGGAKVKVLATAVPGFVEQSFSGYKNLVRMSPFHLASQFSAKPAEIRQLLQGALGAGADRARLTDQMLAAGLPL